MPGEAPLYDVPEGGPVTQHVQPGMCSGYADPVYRSTITGWFTAPDKDPVISALIDGALAGQAAILTSNIHTPSPPDGARTFTFAIPKRYQDGGSHLLALTLPDGSFVSFLGNNGTKSGSLRFRFEAPDPPDANLSSQPVINGGLTGTANYLRGTVVTGWAASLDSPEDPVLLQIYIDEQKVDTVVCDQPSENARGHQDLGRTGSFTYAIPDRFQDGITHSISVRLQDGSALPFPNGRRDVRFTAEALTTIEGVVDGLVGDIIKGWAVRRHGSTGTVTGRVPIQVLCNGIPVGEVTADQLRPDVGRDLRCDARVGFQVRIPPECRNGQEFLFSIRALPEQQDLSGSPLPVRYRASDADQELRLLAATVDELCTYAFKVQQRVRELLPATDASVTNYDAWARRYQIKLRARMATAEPLPVDTPLVSVLMPTYRANLAHLIAAIESVRAQTYPKWELVIVDDASQDTAISACLKSYGEPDHRVHCISSAVNRGISAATNVALRNADGQFVTFLDHDDLLEPIALEAMVREAVRTGAKVVYSDEDKIDDFGVFSEPNLKPDWNYRLLLGVNYVCHLVMAERDLVRQAGSLKSKYDGAQDHDLLLRLSERCPPEQIRHLSEILYHWRKSFRSTADTSDAKPYAIAAGQRAVTDHLRRRGFKGCHVNPVGETTNYAVSWGLKTEPSVTIIIPFKDQASTTRRCVETVLANTEWSDWRVVLVDNGSKEEETAEFCRNVARDPHVVVLRIDEPFNFARLNNLAAGAYQADYYMFVNNDVFISQREWLRVLMDEMLADPMVAVVGAKLVYPDGSVQHAGVVLGAGGVADHAFKGLHADHPGYMSRARLAQQYSAVTAACMLCRADIFLEIGGFDEHDLAIAFNDIDLCLKVGSRGWRVIWTPALAAEHHESLSRGDDMAPQKAARFFRENYVMFERWPQLIEADPFYNKHFSRDRSVFHDLR